MDTDYVIFFVTALFVVDLDMDKKMGSANYHHVNH